MSRPACAHSSGQYDELPCPYPDCPAGTGTYRWTVVTWDRSGIFPKPSAVEHERKQWPTGGWTWEVIGTKDLLP